MSDDNKGILDLGRTCRTCLVQKSNEELKSLLENNLEKVLCEIANIQLNFHSSLPTGICIECLKTLNLALDFRNQVQDAESQLQNLLYSMNEAEQVTPIPVVYRSFAIIDSTDFSKESEKNIGDISGEKVLVIESAEDDNQLCCKASNNKNEKKVFGKFYEENTEIFAVTAESVDGKDTMGFFLSDDDSLNTPRTEESATFNMNRNTILINGNISNVIKWADSENNSTAISNNSIENNQNESVPSQQNFKIISGNTDYKRGENLGMNKTDNNIKADIQGVEKVKRTTNFGCNLCSKKFRYEFGYTTHLLKHGVPIICKVCLSNFTETSLYLDHVKSDHPNFKPFACPSCDKTYSVMSTLKKHYSYHNDNAKSRKFSCEICGKRFSQHNFLVTHKKSHSGENPYQCEVCHKKFSGAHSLRNHLKIHRGEKKHKCEICEARFIHRFSLRAHLRTHSGEKPFTCKLCNNKFSTSSYLKIHMRTHTAEKPYKCLWCQKNFVSRCALAAHEKSHTGEKKFQCDMCGWRSTRLADLQTHIRSHTGEKPYFCDQCEKRYKTASNLAAHKRTHLGLREHKCHICDKAFGDPRTLKSHIRVHTGETPYQCHICGNRFKQSGQLSAHRRTHKT